MELLPRQLLKVDHYLGRGGFVLIEILEQRRVPRRWSLPVELVLESFDYPLYAFPFYLHLIPLIVPANPHLVCSLLDLTQLLPEFFNSDTPPLPGLLILVLVNALVCLQLAQLLELHVLHLVELIQLPLQALHVRLPTVEILEESTGVVVLPLLDHLRCEIALALAGLLILALGQVFEHLSKPVVPFGSGTRLLMPILGVFHLLLLVPGIPGSPQILQVHTPRMHKYLVNRLHLLLELLCAL